MSETSVLSTKGCPVPFTCCGKNKLLVLDHDDATGFQYVSCCCCCWCFVIIFVISYCTVQYSTIQYNTVQYSMKVYGNGQWTMENGQWTTVSGQWTMDNGNDFLPGLHFASTTPSSNIHFQNLKHAI